MKRLLFILRTFTAALSLLLCIASAALWFRSYWVSDSIYHSRWSIQDMSTSESAWWLIASRGQAAIAHRDQRSPTTPQDVKVFQALAAKPEFKWTLVRPPQPLLDDPDAGGFFHPFGFAYMDQPMPPTMAIGGYRQWTAPLWFICLLTAIPPAGWLIRQISRRRRPPGLCLICGYDLRATPGRCPECGNVPIIPTSSPQTPPPPAAPPPAASHTP